MSLAGPVGKGFFWALGLTVFLAAALGFTVDVGPALSALDAPADVVSAGPTWGSPDGFGGSAVDAPVIAPADVSSNQSIRGAFRLDDGGLFWGYQGPAGFARRMLGTVPSDATPDRYQVSLNAFGNYDVPLPAGSWQLEPVATLNQYTTPAPVVVDLPEGQHVDAPPFVYRRYQSTVEGTVLDDEGQPVGVVDVFGQDLDHRMRRPAWTVANTSGQFRLPAGPGRWRIYTGRQPYYGPASAVEVQVPEAGTASVGFVMSRLNGWVTGRLIDHLGNALPWGRLDVRQPIVDSRGLSIDATASATSSDQLGRYTLRLPAGQQTIRAAASSSGFYPYFYPTYQQVTVSQDATVYADIVIPKVTSRVIGIVRNAQGALAGGATVEALQGDVVRYSTTWVARDATADSFTLWLPDGQWDIRATKPGSGLSRRTALTLAANQVQWRELSLSGIVSYLPAILRTFTGSK